MLGSEECHLKINTKQRNCTPSKSTKVFFGEGIKHHVVIYVWHANGLRPLWFWWDLFICSMCVLCVVLWCVCNLFGNCVNLLLFVGCDFCVFCSVGFYLYFLFLRLCKSKSRSQYLRKSSRNWRKKTAFTCAFVTRLSFLSVIVYWIWSSGRNLLFKRWKNWKETN